MNFVGHTDDAALLENGSEDVSAVAHNTANGAVVNNDNADVVYLFWVMALLSAFEVVHVLIGFATMALIYVGQLLAALTVVVASIIGATIVTSRIDSRNPRRVATMEEQFRICDVPITGELILCLVSVTVFGFLWLLHSSAFDLPLCTPRLWPIVVMIVVVVWLGLLAKRGSRLFRTTMSTKCAIALTAMPAMFERGVDGETAGQPLSSPLPCLQHLGWILVMILVQAAISQILFARVIRINFRNHFHEAMADNYKRLAKYAIILDLRYIARLMLEIAEQVAREYGAPDDTILYFQNEIGSESFKTKGIHENLPQIWITAILIQSSWGVVPQQVTILQCANVFLALFTIWEGALPFWRIQVTGLDTWRVWPGALWWKSMRIFYMTLALVLTSGSLLHLAAIPYCGPHTSFTWTHGCQVATCGNSTVKFNGTLIDEDCFSF